MKPSLSVASFVLLSDLRLYSRPSIDHIDGHLAISGKGAASLKDDGDSMVPAPVEDVVEARSIILPDAASADDHVLILA
jgi:hypothetical protein